MYYLLNISADNVDNRALKTLLPIHFNVLGSIGTQLENIEASFFSTLIEHYDMLF